MRITGIESFHADGGWRPFSFLKLTTDEGLTGWSEYACGPWAPALPAVIEALGQRIIGRDPRDFAVLRLEMNATARFASGGLNCQAAAAIENACIDIAAKAAGLPVWKYFGGAVRDRIDLYWTHCGSFRVRDTDFFERVLGREPLTDLAAMQRLGTEVRQRGFKAAKTNPIHFTGQGGRLLNPGFVPQGLNHAGTLDAEMLAAIEAQLEAFRDGAGPTTDLMLDVNFAYTPQTVARLEQRIERFGLRWLEYDNQSPGALADLRQGLRTPLASLEAVHEAIAYKPFLDANGVDVAVVDLLWNGFAESLRVAQLCRLSAINVAPHNFYGPIADLIAANFCAVAANIEIMEFEGDDVPWKYDLLTVAPTIEASQMLIPTGIGWGADIDGAALDEHCWRR